MKKEIVNAVKVAAKVTLFLLTITTVGIFLTVCVNPTFFYRSGELTKSALVIPGLCLVMWGAVLEEHAIKTDRKRRAEFSALLNEIVEECGEDGLNEILRSMSTSSNMKKAL